MRFDRNGFLFLSEADMLKCGVLDTKKCCEIMEEVFELLSNGDFRLSGYNNSSHGCMVTFPKISPFEQMPKDGPDRRFGAMPAYLGGRFHLIGLKFYGSNIANKNLGLPRSILMTYLADADTSEPIALLSANLASSCRTGSVTGVASKYLAREGAESLAIIGCGVINYSCTSAILNSLSSIKRIYIFDINKENAVKFKKDLFSEFPLEYIICDSLENCLINADVISLAASGKEPVVISERMLKPGSLLTVTGDFSSSSEFFQNISIVFDYWPMHKEWHEEILNSGGYENSPDYINSRTILREYNNGKLKEKDFHSLGDIICNKHCARNSNEEKVLFMAGGIPLEDIAWGYACYEEAVRMELGKRLAIWDKPHLL